MASLFCFGGAGGRVAQGGGVITLGGGFDCGVGFASKGLGSAAAAGKGVVAGKVRGAIT